MLADKSDESEDARRESAVKLPPLSHAHSHTNPADPPSPVQARRTAVLGKSFDKKLEEKRSEKSTHRKCKSETTRTSPSSTSLVHTSTLAHSPASKREVQPYQSLETFELAQVSLIREPSASVRSRCVHVHAYVYVHACASVSPVLSSFHHPRQSLSSQENQPGPRAGAAGLCSRPAPQGLPPSDQPGHQQDIAALSPFASLALLLSRIHSRQALCA